MPRRRPAPLSDELLVGGCDAEPPTAAVSQLLVKNTFLDAPSGLTPSAMADARLATNAAAEVCPTTAPAALRRPGLIEGSLTTAAKVWLPRPLTPSTESPSASTATPCPSSSRSASVASVIWPHTPTTPLATAQVLHTTVARSCLQGATVAPTATAPAHRLTGLPVPQPRCRPPDHSPRYVPPTTGPRVVEPPRAALATGPPRRKGCWADVEDDDTDPRATALVHPATLVRVARPHSQRLGAAEPRLLAVPPPPESPKLPPDFWPSTPGSAPSCFASPGQIFACVANAPVPKCAPPLLPAPAPTPFGRQPAPEAPPQTPGPSGCAACWSTLRADAPAFELAVGATGHPAR